MTARLALLALLLLAPRLAQAQLERCFFDNTPETRTYGNKLPSGQFNTFYGAGINVRCPSKKLTIRADSLEFYGDIRRLYLVGHVVYNEPRFRLSAEFLNYYVPDERIVANTNVIATLPSGSTMKGQQVEYLRVIPNVRPRTRITAIARPTITAIEKDKAGKQLSSSTIVGNTLVMDNEELVYGSGDVQIDREDVFARADSAFIDNVKEYVELIQLPRIEGKKGHQFTLSGQRIHLYSKAKKLQRVLSMRLAEAKSKDLTMRADTIDLRLKDELLDRAVAWGPGRAHADAKSQNISADSIDVLMPGQKVREVHALRNALAEAQPDSSKFITTEKDWLRGDTLVAKFDTVATGDTTQGPAIRQIVASGTAGSYQHMPPTDTVSHRPAINYVTGRLITVDFAGRQLRTVHVIDQKNGLYLEPVADTTEKAAAGKRAPDVKRPPAKPPQGP
ncbi:MAG: hypothetical protein JWO05_493 [Gemmatimonadetes bacterium]|nr:hypothetical protein [Gemmatimonadota bacterium]